MKVLVTGVNGQLGDALRRALPAGIELQGLAHAELDIADARSVDEIVTKLSPALVINAAAYTAVDLAETNSEAAHAGNTEGPLNLARAVSGVAGCRLIHVSTDFVFDGTSPIPYSIDSPPNPLSVYGRTKLAGERAIQQTLATAVILRTAWVYSRHGKNFLTTMLRVMNEKRAVRVVSDQVGTPTAACSLAGILWKLAMAPRVHGIHHWTDAGVASWYDFAVAIAEEGAAAGLVPPDVRVTPIATREYPTPARRPAYSVLDKRATYDALGVEPVHWRQQLRRVLRDTPNA